jgi:hypothetical protein
MDGNLNTIREKVFRVLARELGAADTVNFLRQFENRSGNYTEERERALAGITVDEIVACIKERKKEKTR